MLTFLITLSNPFPSVINFMMFLATFRIPFAAMIKPLTFELENFNYRGNTNDAHPYGLYRKCIYVCIYIKICYSLAMLHIYDCFEVFEKKVVSRYASLVDKDFS